MLDGVTFTYANRPEPSLRDASLTLPRSSLTVLVGPTGSGKTTVCSLISGVIPHLQHGELKGRVLVDAVETAGSRVRDLAVKVGYVFQDPEVMFCNLRVEDEVAFGPENLGMARQRIQGVVASSLSRVGLAGLDRRLVWQLSGGQVQKLGVATVLAMSPGVLVLDEPTANLDPAATVELQRILRELRSDGHTILLVSKDLDQFVAEADQLLVLESGAVRYAGRPAEVISSHGEELQDSIGVWLPQSAEIGLFLRRRRWPVTSIPLTIEAAADLLSRFTFADPPPRGSEPGEGAREPVVEVEHVAFRYSNGVEALRDATFSIPANRFTAIAGQNGAGKSTIAKLLVGLVRPASGSLRICGRPCAEWSAHELAARVGLVFQNPEHQFLTDVVSEEVAYTLRAQGGADEAGIRKAVDDILDALDLLDVRDEHPFALSEGKKRRLGVATMLAGNPEVLIVDEPTYGQDKAMTESLMALMERMRRRGVTIVMITHDMRLVQRFADHVVVMADGRTIFEGGPGDLFDDAEVLSRASLRPPDLTLILSRLSARGLKPPAGIRTLDDLAAATRLPEST